MAESHAAASRALLAQARQATLATLALDPAGFPFASLVAVADDGGRPLLLLSGLAEHTRNLRARPEASLLVVGAPAADDPLSAARLTLIGPCAPVSTDEVVAAREVFLRAHPEASVYAGFADFALYRLEPIALRFVGGFGRMSWVDAEEFRRVER